MFFILFTITATNEICTLSLHDALPIYDCGGEPGRRPAGARFFSRRRASRRAAQVTLELVDSHCHLDDEQFDADRAADRKSTRLNSSHPSISYAVFCLKKKSQLREAGSG